MASIAIRSLDEEVKTRLRVRAAEHHRSMEEEARLILRDAVGPKEPPRNLVSAIRAKATPDPRPREARSGCVGQLGASAGEKTAQSPD